MFSAYFLIWEQISTVLVYKNWKFQCILKTLKFNRVTSHPRRTDQQLPWPASFYRLRPQPTSLQTLSLHPTRSFWALNLWTSTTTTSMATIHITYSTGNAECIYT